MIKLSRISIQKTRPFFRFSSDLKTAEPRKNEELARKYLRGIHRQKYGLKKGDVIENFELLKIENFKDFNVNAYFLEHTEAKIPFIHLDTADTNNCFALIFRTPAINNKGFSYIFMVFFLYFIGFFVYFIVFCIFSCFFIK